MGRAELPRRTINYNMGAFNIFYCLLLIISLEGSDALEVRKNLPPVEALLNHNVTIPCMILGYKDPELDVNNVAIHWTRKTRDGKVEDVYEYNNGVHKKIRLGSEILERELVKGNAGLFIPLIELSDQGEYTCNVFSTPHKAAGTSALEVLAPPIAEVLPSPLIIAIMTEKSVVCEARNFYPEPLRLKWVQYLKDNNSCIALEKKTCTGSPVKNPDGTYNVTSHLTLTPSKEDDGNKYACILEHKTIFNERVLDFYLTVKEQETNTGQIVGAIIGTFVAAAIIIFVLVFVYNKYLKKIPPKLSVITGNERMVHMSKATLSCQITGFKPRPIEVILEIKKVGCAVERLYSWKPSDTQQAAEISTRPNNGGDFKIVIEPEQEQLLKGIHTTADNPLLKEMQLEVRPVMKSNKDLTFTCHWSMDITPDIEQLNNAELFLKVKHPSLTGQSSMSCVLNVIGVSPKLSNIVTPLRIIHDEPLTLTCPINGFKPKPLTIIWIKMGLDKKETKLLTWDTNSDKTDDAKYSHNLVENEHEDSSFSFLSILMIKPKINEDNGAKYFCRTYHTATDTQAEKSLEMLIWALPELDTIQQSQEVLYVGEQIHLSCKIHSFFPKAIIVQWYKDNDPLECNNDNILAEADGRFHFTSSLSYIVNVKDINKIFKCEVVHQSLEKPKSVTWKMENLVSIPKITNIKCEPEVPECNKPVRLLCTVADYYPEECTIHWYQGTQSIMTDSQSENTKQDEASGLFSRTTSLQFIPTAKDHGKEYCVEVSHSHKVPVTQKMFLALRGFPVIKDIYSETVPKYGEPVTICCNVKACNPQDIKTEWLQNHLPVKKGMTTETRVNKDKEELILSYLLKLIPTAENHGQVFSCLVKHRDMPQPINKVMYLRLPEKPPVLSELTLSPGKPEINRETTFRINISGFAPEGVQVKWYRAFTEFTENIVTSKPKIQKDYLYSCTSELKYVPRGNDDNVSIRCEVIHTFNRKIQERQYVLKLKGSTSNFSAETANQGLKTQPHMGNEGRKSQISGIQCLTKYPKIGQDVSLACFIEGLNVEHGSFCWYNGMYPIDEEQIQNTNKQDGSGCISTFTFKPEESDRECKIKCEVTFNFETMEKTYVLNLG
ncbi:natural cytotoxicity triggering receptor 3 ligand 1 [Discoglossus pictus]